MEQNGLDHDSRSSIDTANNDTQKTFLKFRSYTQLSEKLASNPSYATSRPNDDSSKGVATAAVSYTHLDVYKRQSFKRSLISHLKLR